MDEKTKEAATLECVKASDLINEVLRLNDISESGAISGCLTMLISYLDFVGMSREEQEKITAIVYGHAHANGHVACTVEAEEL